MKTIESPRFGMIQVEDEVLIRFAGGLPGFPDCEEFIVMEHDKETPLRWLHSVDRPEVAFLIVEPAQVLASYRVEVPAEVLAGLGWDEASDEPRDVAIFAIMNAGESGLTANLRAPVVVHMKTRRARQMILDDPELPLRHLIRPDEPAAD